CVLHSEEQTTNTESFVVDTVIRIMPPLCVENLLACDLDVKLFRQRSGQMGSAESVFNDRIESGQRRFIYSVDLRDSLSMFATMPGWTGSGQPVKVFQNLQGAEMDTRFYNIDSQGRPLPLRIDYNSSGLAHHEITVFCSYWIINFTDKPI